jgi:hypothetical protein
MTAPAAGKDRGISLLLLLCRSSFTDDERQRAAAEAGSLQEWNRFTDLLVRHGVAALVWQSLSDLSLAALVPETERTILEGSRLRSVARVAYITSVAAEVAQTLEKEGIRVVLLKGLALEHQVYGARGLRQMSDADLLVSPRDALRARDILIRAGFVSNSLKSRLYRHIILDIGNHLPELHRGGISVDLHHRLFGREGTELVARAMENAEVIDAGGQSLFVLPPLTAFLGLVSHIGKHEIKGEFQLRLYIDIYLLLRKYHSEIISENLPAAAAEAGIEKETRDVLTLMDRVWGLTVTAESGIAAEEGDALTLTKKSWGLTVPGEAGMATKRDAAPTLAERAPGLTESVESGMVPETGGAPTVAGRKYGLPRSSGINRFEEQQLVDAFLSKIRQPWSVPSLSQREFFLRNLQSFDSRWKRIIFITGDLFPSVEFMKRRYGCRTGLKTLLFYPHRLGKLLWVLDLKRGGYQDD